jgi:hypothetical protein
VNGGLVGDGVVDEQHPEALVYEPKNNHFELVAVEFIVLASQWMLRIPTTCRRR